MAITSELALVSGPLALHLSDGSAATEATMTAAGVTHVVNATLDAPMPTCAAGMRVPVEDDIDAPLHQHLDQAWTFIDEALRGGGRVLVFCPSGLSATPAIVAYYLMRSHGLSLSDALGTIRVVMPDAWPNVGFWQRLVEAESWLHGGDAPSMSVQQYKWQFLERRSDPGTARESTLQRLEMGQAEVQSLLHHNSYTLVG